MEEYVLFSYSIIYDTVSKLNLFLFDFLHDIDESHNIWVVSPILFFLSFHGLAKIISL